MDKKTQGKKNKASGARFELKVRKDLESKGWIVSKWMNNVEFDKIFVNTTCPEIGYFYDTKGNRKPISGKLIPAKHKFRGPGIPMAIGTGFPDFIVFSPADSCRPKIIGVEVKSNGYLDKVEKEKCKWLLDNNVFSKIIIASKSKKRGEIVYKEIAKNQ